MSILLLALVASCGGDDDPESSTNETPCERLRDHLIDLRLADAKHVDQAAHRDAMKQSMGADFLESCAKLDSSQVNCVLDAPDTTSASACATRPPRS